MIDELITDTKNRIIELENELRITKNFYKILNPKARGGNKKKTVYKADINEYTSPIITSFPNTFVLKNIHNEPTELNTYSNKANIKQKRPRVNKKKKISSRVKVK